LELPRRIEATGFECVVSCVTMVSMYWRKEVSRLGWNMPEDSNAPEWDEFYKRGCKFISPMSGVALRKIDGYLKSIQLPLTLKLAPLHGVYVLEKLTKCNIPPIVLFDFYYYHKGIVKNPFHAAVVMEVTAENILTVDPSFINKDRTAYYRREFEKAWNIAENHAIVIYPKVYRLRGIGRTARPLEAYAGVSS